MSTSVSRALRIGLTGLIWFVLPAIAFVALLLL